VTTDEIEDALFEILQPLLPEGVKLIWSDPSAPRPPKPYVMMDFLVYGRRVGKDELRQSSSGWDRKGLREFVLSVNAYGQDAHEILDELLTGMSLESTVAALSEANFSSVNESEIRDLTLLIEQRYETRAQIDLTFYRTVTKPEELDWFDKVEVNDQLV